MSEDLKPLSLAGLQQRLDSLAADQELAIALSDYRRLFGLNDIAHARLDNFAQGHDCTAHPRVSAIVFRKVSTSLGHSRAEPDPISD
jgi:hypothetical protein